MNVKEVIKKAIEDAVFLLNDEFESVIDQDIAKRYEIVLNDLQKALHLVNKLPQEKRKWKNSLN
ncbi:MAG: hypothetical protein OEV87_09585 [Phycisphaerae bacterium]|nr:hypothetical protein [Phycisphaerae bacterium]